MMIPNYNNGSNNNLDQSGNFQSNSNMSMGSAMQQQQQQLAQSPTNNNGMNNPYAQEYYNTVKENRSLYGNYLDNSLAYDRYKENKSMYNVVFDTDGYNPWGKPGGGAPKIDTNTGQLRTKIVGTLKWNLNGETEDDRVKRLAATQKNPSPNKNILLYRKNPFSGSPNASPRPVNNNPTETRGATTYNYNYRDPFSQGGKFGGSANDLNQMSSNDMRMSYPQPGQQQQQQQQQQPTYQQFQQQQQPQSQSPTLPAINQPQFEMTQIEREAHQRKMKNNMYRTKNEQELNRVSNKLYNDNQPTVDYPNNPYWFGRTGAHNTSSIGSFTNPSSSSSSYMGGDVRRRKLLDTLENREIQANNKYMSNSAEYLPPNAQYSFVNSPHSNHRNLYENPLQMN